MQAYCIATTSRDERISRTNYYQEIDMTRDRFYFAFFHFDRLEGVEKSTKVLFRKEDRIPFASKS